MITTITITTDGTPVTLTTAAPVTVTTDGTTVMQHTVTTAEVMAAIPAGDDYADERALMLLEHDRGTAYAVVAHVLMREGTAGDAVEAWSMADTLYENFTAVQEAARGLMAAVQAATDSMVTGDGAPW
jgi:hypothetical protein